MAVNFLDEILVKLNGTSSSKKYLQLNGGGGSGSVSGQAGVGFRPLNAGSNVHASIEALENGNASYQTNLTFNTNGSSSDSAPSERMRITSAGNVGVGTTSPTEKLDVVGNIKASGRVYINGTGNFIDTTRNASSQANYIKFYDSSTSAVEAYVGFTSNNRDFKIDSANGSGTLTLKAGGGTAVHVTSSQNVGIGTTSPSTKLHVSGGDIRVDDTERIEFGSGGVRINNDAAGRMYYNAPLGYYWQTTGGYRMVLDSSGRLGVGTTSPATKLDILDTVNQTAIRVTNNNYNNYLIQKRRTDNSQILGIQEFGSNGGLSLVTGSSQRVNVNNLGNVGIGTTTPSQKLEVSGKAKVTTSLAVGAITPSATTGRIDASNDVVAFSTSDIRLKDNIKSIDKALDKVNKIQGIEFDWIEKEEVHGNSGHDIGVIAQEIEKVLPDVVTTRDNGYKAVKYEKIVPLLIEAIKDLSKQVDGLKRLI